ATPAGSPVASPIASPGASPMASPAAGDPSLNPLGVDPNAPLDVVIFKGGYGDEYALYVNDQMYKRLYPGTQITYAGTQRLQEQYQARFVEGNPPDIMDNSGAGNFNTTNLVNEGQLADLTDLMEAPAWGQENMRFADTLVPGSQEAGVFNGTQYVLRYAYTVYGLWYSARFMEQNGYSYPQTWDDMLALSEDIKAGGVAPWTFQGQYPYYIRSVFDQLVYKAGGIEAIARLDNLEEGAWQSEEVGAALNALYQLVERGYILEGTEALSHTESQALWLQGRAAFIPCGSWLENEMRDVVAQDPNLADFRMTVAATPSLTGEDRLPQPAIQASAGEDFIVPAQGRNVQGGKEYLRLLFSKEGGRFFSESTRSLSVVTGAADGLDLGTAFASTQGAVQAAGENTFVAQYYNWYVDLDEETQNLFGQMMAGQLSPQDVMDGAEDAATAVREDDSIPKYQRQV
ncbi:MAG: N-acetylglucosamine/diacetylchitobiose ABC transporter substrate-binding protein, partial [Chloroflexota bacterium]|nr:N-acetylglucosamine/diacetylchitobiose ABC transporter substrate-binding protein [Chloroflexota bacterium]